MCYRCANRQRQPEAFQASNHPCVTLSVTRPAAMPVQRASPTDRQQLCADPAPRCEHTPAGIQGLRRNGAQRAPPPSPENWGVKQAPEDPQPRMPAWLGAQGRPRPPRPARTHTAPKQIRPTPPSTHRSPEPHSRSAAAPAAAGSTSAPTLHNPSPPCSPGRPALSHHSSGAVPPALTGNWRAHGHRPAAAGGPRAGRAPPSPAGCQRAAAAACPGAGAGCAGGRGRAGARSSAS